ncbi:MFS transporter (plasmid) [Streptomyces sp. SDT5-1]|uniref:MFS transporter n=1 Tax=Streptomyces sp. SDT5-1 TaxID=3406418 RepID=UPI003FD07AF9
MTTADPIAPPARRARHAHRPVGWSAVLRLPYTVRLLTGTLISRLPLGMGPVVFLTAARADGHSTAHGAALAAVFALAVAAGQPLTGRLVDHLGQTAPTLACAAAHAAAFTALALTGTRDPALAMAGALVAGATAPSAEANLRALWPRLTPDQQHLRAAYTLDSGSQELVYVAGPLLAATLAGLGGPALALAATGALTAAGTALVITSAPSRTWRPEPAVRRSLLGALAPAGMRTLLLALVAVLGAVNVAAISAGERYAAGWLSGAMPAALSIGALIGSALAAARTPTAPLPTQLLTTAGVFALAWCPLALARGPHLALAFTLLPGLVFGPLLTCCYQAIDRMAAPGTVTESYSWLVSAVGVGIAAGTALAGPLDAPLALPAAAAAVAFLLLTVTRRHLTRPQPAPPVPGLEAAA